MQLRLATQAMGTRFELVLEGSDEPHLRAVGEEALAEIAEISERFSLFRRDSFLSHINRSAAQGPVRVDADTLHLLSICDEVHRASGGVFDPTVAPLMHTLNLHDDASSAAAINRSGIQPSIGWHSNIRLSDKPPEIHFRNPGVALDLGGVAKGHGLDLAVRVLREHGIERALLHGGTSTVVALGRPKHQPGWRIAIGTDETAPVAVLADAALSVSSPDGRIAEREGRTLGHVLDPSCHEAAAEVPVAAVVAQTGALADAWSTAVLVGGSRIQFPPELEVLFATGAPDALKWHHHCSGEASFTSFNNILM